MELVQIVDPDFTRARNIVLPPGLLTTDLSAVLDDPEIEAVVQLIGGLEPDRTIMLKVLESGKNVITANKALLAEHGRELFDRARQLGPVDRLRGGRGRRHPDHRRHQPVAGGQPDPVDPRHPQRHEQFHPHADGGRRQDYADALAEAQQLGYAEANPAMDVNGSDAAQKLAILAHLAFGARVDWKDIPRTGIDTVDVADMRYARELGYSIKLLAVAELVPEGLELHVSPTLVRHRSPLAQVRGAYNAIASWATPWAGSSSTAWAPARCPPPRPAWPT